MGKIKFLLVFLGLVLFSLSFVSSAHYITGYVEAAKDGELADNHVVVMWNPVNGMLDNLTDIIGVNGNAGFQGVYFLDCEMLSAPCSFGDEIRVKVVDSGDSYISNYSSVIVTSAGYDVVDNLSLNSPPIVSINFPLDNHYTNENPLGINCSFVDFDNSGILSLYGNFSGSFSFIDSVFSINGSYVFDVPLSEGRYSYYCSGDDGLVVKNSSVFNLIADFTNPSINSFLLNESLLCGPMAVRLGCDTSDANNIDNVLIEIISPSSAINYSAENISLSNYVVDVNVDEVGFWDFYCYSEDLAGNIERSEVNSMYSYSGFPEVSINSGNISFSDDSPIEGQSVLMTAYVYNKGCVSADNFYVSFYLGDPLVSGVLIDEVFGSLGQFSNDGFSVNYNSFIGRNDVYVYVDSYDVILEYNESDNIDYAVLNVPSWQDFYGNISAVKILSGFENMTSWNNYTQIEGSVFMTDSEANIDWSSLVALGRDKIGGVSSNDFYEVDDLLGMNGYFDSVSSIYSSYFYDDFFVRKENLTEVPTINSTDNENFVTGILWDSSDSLDLEYDSFEKEDLVFVSKINKNAVGKYGSYDYEIRIPAKLREYDSSDVSDIYFYYELV